MKGVPPKSLDRKTKEELVHSKENYESSIDSSPN